MGGGGTCETLSGQDRGKTALLYSSSPSMSLRRMLWPHWPLPAYHHGWRNNMACMAGMAVFVLHMCRVRGERLLAPRVLLLPVVACQPSL